MARRAAWLEQEGGRLHVQAAKPDVLGPALNDLPAGLAARTPEVSLLESPRRRPRASVYAG